MPAIPLSPAQLAALHQHPPAWSVVNGRLRREPRFADFVEAFGFMSQVALVAEAMGHHREWRNVWNRVVVELITNDMGGLSNLDMELARRIDQLI